MLTAKYILQFFISLNELVFRIILSIFSLIILEFIILIYTFHEINCIHSSNKMNLKKLRIYCLFITMVG